MRGRSEKAFGEGRAVAASEKQGEGGETFEDEASCHGRQGLSVILWRGEKQLRAGPYPDWSGMPGEDELCAFRGSSWCFASGYAEQWYLSRCGSRPQHLGPEVQSCVRVLQQPSTLFRLSSHNQECRRNPCLFQDDGRPMVLAQCFSPSLFSLLEIIP